MKQSLTKYVSEFTTEGHRVLVWAAKQITMAEYEQWLTKAKGSGASQAIFNSSEELISEISESSWAEIESDLICSGFTVVSDKLQDGVANVITYAKNCGITVVMATGDSTDTAEAIWRKLKQIPEGSRVEKLISSELVVDGKINKQKTEEKLSQYAATFSP